MFDIFGRRLSRKEAKRQVIAENRMRGKAGEDNARLNLTIQGYEVERSPRGRDFIARKRDILSGKVIQTKHIEVKTGNAKLSKLQERTKREKSNYKVMRENPIGFFGRL